MSGWLSEIVTDYSRLFVLNAAKAGPHEPVSSLKKQLKFESPLLRMFVSSKRKSSVYQDAIGLYLGVIDLVPDAKTRS